MSIALLVVPFILVALLEHSELAVNSFRDLISILEQCVPCQLEVLKIMGKYHVQLQSLTHFKLLMELQEQFQIRFIACSFNISPFTQCRWCYVPRLSAPSYCYSIAYLAFVYQSCISVG